MKKVILLMFALFVSIGTFSRARIPDETVLLKGILGALPSNAVSVALRWDKTLVATFERDIDNVTVTVSTSIHHIECQTITCLYYPP